jgi:hypothetical protein
MSFKFRGENENVRRIASKINKALNKPYGYETEDRIVDIPDFSEYDEGLSRENASWIAVSAIGSLMIFSTFVYADNVKDFLGEVVSTPSDVRDAAIRGGTGLARDFFIILPIDAVILEIPTEGAH